MAQAEALHAALTPRQRETLRAINDFQSERGYAPTVRDIMAIVGTASVSTIHWHLVVLRDLGLLTWMEGQARTLALTDRGRKAL